MLLHVVAVKLLQVELGLEKGDGHSEARVDFRGLAGQLVGGFGDVEHLVKMNKEIIYRARRIENVGLSIR